MVFDYPVFAILGFSDRLLENDYLKILLKRLPVCALAHKAKGSDERQ
jgi:hypothetical protein